MAIATEDFATFVERRFGGKLTKGAHSPDGAACLHEAVNVWQGREWSDSTKGTLDFRGLNDAPWSSDEARTAAMLPLGPLVIAWPSWSPERRRASARLVAEQTIRRVLPIALRAAAAVHPVPEHVAALLKAAEVCVAEGTQSSAAWAAAWAYADEPLRLIAAILVEAAEATA